MLLKKTSALSSHNELCHLKKEAFILEWQMERKMITHAGLPGFEMKISKKQYAQKRPCLLGFQNVQIMLNLLYFHKKFSVVFK